MCETDISRVDLSCFEFDRVSMINAIFSHTNVNGTKLHGTNLDHSNLNGILFNNVDLSTTTLSQEQTQVARFENAI